MRFGLLATVFGLMTSSAAAETWIVREGECGEWQSRWSVEQDQGGLWSGVIDSVHVGGPCARRTSATVRTEVKASIAGDYLFALRGLDDGRICSYTAQFTRTNRGEGVVFCEKNEERSGFVIHFRAPQDSRSMRELPPDDELLSEDQRRDPERRFRPRGGLDRLYRQ
jgi:hypothetical protein